MLLISNEHRARGLGRFLTPADLAKMEGRTLGNIMRQMPGLAIVQGRSGQSWVAGKHSPMTRCPPTGYAVSPAAQRQMQDKTDECLRAERVYYVPEAYEESQGVMRDCYALVYLDRSLMNAGRPTPPFDLNSLAPGRIEAIEWFESAAEVPPTLNVRDAQCGLAILHSRRTP